MILIILFMSSIMVIIKQRIIKVTIKQHIIKVIIEQLKRIIIKAIIKLRIIIKQVIKHNFLQPLVQLLI